MKRALWVVALLAACGGGNKPEATDDFSAIGDEKSDAFSKKMQVVGTIGSGEPQKQLQIAYAPSPIYRALKLSGHAGELIKIEINGSSGKVNTGGDPVTWLLDSKFKVVAKNDDVSKSNTDSQLVVTLKKSGTFYIVVRDYNYASVTFTVNFVAAMPSDDVVAWAGAVYNLYAEDDYDLASTHSIATGDVPGDAAAQQLADWQSQGLSLSAYAFPVGNDTLYAITGGAEEVLWGALYDADGNYIAQGFDGDGGPGMDFSATPPPMKSHL